MPPIELHDIQGLLRHGYPYFEAAAYVLLEVEDAADTRAWLTGLLAEDWIDNAEVRAARLLNPKDSPQERCGVAIAFTASGIEKLGLACAMPTFVGEFQEGMAAPHRSRLLGDVEKNCPTRWHWGGPRDRDKLDILLLVYAAAHEIDDRLDDLLSIKGCPTVLREMRARRGTSEPFGFADGVSQPLVEGLNTLPIGTTRERLIKAGEFVLGYADEFGQHPASPSVASEDDPARILPFAAGGRADFGRNGTFLVLRQLQQDVEAFKELARQHPDLPPRIIGRWPDGSALTQYPNRSPSENLPVGHERSSAELSAENDFTYQRGDRHGFNCPLGAHVRRANPRDSLVNHGIDATTAKAMANRHRLLRRGRPYEEDSGERGIYFLCLNTNIERQFEFVQRTWSMNAEFHGLRAESDPLLGNATAGTPRTMTIQRPWRNECSPALGDFVTVKGGGYFFMPGMRALKYLARSSGGTKSHFTSPASSPLCRAERG